MTKTEIEMLMQGITALQINLTSHAQQQLLTYIELLQKWNRAYNLVANAETEEIITQHILDSLSIASYIDGQNILDVGTGAGFPGIPLAIIFPYKQFTLLDSISKKIQFLMQVKNQLKLPQVEVVQMRVERYFPSACFDNIVTRAFGSAPDIIEKTQHLLCPKGKLLLMKGQVPKEELKEISWKIQIYPLKVPGLNKQRHLICLEK